jgi:hypothetical protein
MRVAGVGGTGKTYLIDAICTMLDPEETIVIAPTGRASNNILGATYHSFFAIYPGQSRTSGLKGMLTEYYHLYYFLQIKNDILFQAIH